MCSGIHESELCNAAESFALSELLTGVLCEGALSAVNAVSSC